MLNDKIMSYRSDIYFCKFEERVKLFMEIIELFNTYIDTEFSGDEVIQSKKIKLLQDAFTIMKQEDAIKSADFLILEMLPFLDGLNKEGVLC